MFISPFEGRLAYDYNLGHRLLVPRHSYHCSRIAWCGFWRRMEALRVGNCRCFRIFVRHTFASTSTRSLLTPTLVSSRSCHPRLLFAAIKDNCSPQHVANSVQSIVRSSLLQIPGTKRRFKRSSQVWSRFEVNWRDRWYYVRTLSMRYFKFDFLLVPD